MKPLFVISCPIDTYSGYGARSRDLIKAIIETNKYEVKIIPQRWGSTPWNFIEDHKEWRFLKDYLQTTPNLPKQPDVWMQITIPNEFQPIGKYNIGVTAGVETTLVHQSWIEGCNKMNLVITSSEFAKKTFQNTKYEAKNQQGLSQGFLELKTPIEVIFEGANTEIYKYLNPEELSGAFNKLDEIKENFCYLFVGHWIQGDFGEDRKNVGLLVKAFYETFKNKKNKPALILKTSGAGSSYMDRDSILNKINSIRKSVNSTNLPNIYLLHGDFSDQEINELYNHSKVKAMVSLTKGEGFGRPLLEFSLSKKPIMVSGWSGHMDFLKPEFNLIINGGLKNVDPSAVVPNMILAESQWFYPDPSSTGNGFKDMHKNYKKYLELAKRQAHYSKTNFSWEKMDELLSSHLDKNIPKFAKQVTLNLPKLNTSNKLELPKLKK